MTWKVLDRGGGGAPLGDADGEMPQLIFQNVILLLTSPAPTATGVAKLLVVTPAEVELGGEADVYCCLQSLFVFCNFSFAGKFFFKLEEVLPGEW